MILFMFAKPATATAAVVGALEYIESDGIASGWALDPRDYAASIAVRGYVDGPATDGQFIGTVVTNIPRLDLARPGPHGFRFSIPTRYRDGQPHKLYVYGVELSGQSKEELLLSGAPRSFTLSST